MRATWARWPRTTHGVSASQHVPRPRPVSGFGSRRERPGRLWFLRSEGACLDCRTDWSFGDEVFSEENALDRSAAVRESDHGWRCRKALPIRRRRIELNRALNRTPRNLWLCSNTEMAAQVRRDDPEAVCYTTHELRELIKLNPGSEDLKSCRF